MVYYDKSGRRIHRPVRRSDGPQSPAAPDDCDRIEAGEADTDPDGCVE